MAVAVMEEVAVTVSMARVVARAIARAVVGGSSYTKSNKMVELCFESLQMDSRYWVRYKMHRLGIWIDVKVYLFMWIYVKSFIKHLFVLL